MAIEGTSPAADREMAVLLLSARRDLEASEASRLRSLLAAGVDGARLLRLGGWHGLLPLLHRHVLERAPGSLPREIEEILARRAREVAGRALVQAGRLLEVLEALRSSGIAAAAFKGPALAVQAYGRLGLRDHLDLDILVRPADIPQASGVLKGLSYEPIPDGRGGEDGEGLDGALAFGRADGSARIELHGRFFTRHEAVRLEEGAALDRRRDVEICRRPVPALAPGDLLLYLGVHGAKHLWERLEWLASFAEVCRLEGLDWGWIGREARRRGIRRMLAAGLLLSRILLGRPVPPGAEAVVAGDAVAERLAVSWARGIRDRCGSPPAPLDLVRSNLAGRERLRDRARLVLRLAFLPTCRDRRAVSLPGPLRPLHAALRPFRLLRRYGWKP